MTAQWPIEPVIDELDRRLGEWDQDNNPWGNNYRNAAVVLSSDRWSISAEVWGRKVRRGWLTDAEADRVATQLGYNPVAFWPAFGDVALEHPDTADEIAAAS